MAFIFGIVVVPIFGATYSGRIPNVIPMIKDESAESCFFVFFRHQPLLEFDWPGQSSAQNEFRVPYKGARVPIF